MAKLPERITGAWMGSLTDLQLLDAEKTLRKRFDRADKSEHKKLGASYDRTRWGAELLLAWDRWSRVNGTARARRLNPIKA